MSAITKKTEFKLFFTVWIIYIFFLSGYGGGYISESTFHQTMSIVEKGTFQVDDYLKPGCKKTGCDYSFYNGHFYSGFAPGGSFIAIPLYIILRPITEFIPRSFLGYPQVQLKTVLLTIFAAIFIVSLLSALTSVLIYKFCLKRTKSQKYSLLLALTFAFGTLFFLHSTDFHPRAIAGSLLLISFFLINETRNLSNKRLIFSGFLAGFATTMNFPIILISSLLFLYTLFLLRNRRSILFFIAFLLPILLFLLYNYLIFDSPLTTSYEFRVNSKDLELFQDNPLGISLNFTNIVKTFLEYSFLPRFGIFIYSPIFLISLFGIYFGIKDKQYRKETIFLALAFLSEFIFYTTFVGRDICGFGLRYILPGIPFLILLITYAFTKVRFLFILILSAISIFFNLLGPMFYTTCTPYNLFNFYIPQLFKQGLSNYTLNLLSLKLLPLSLLTKNIIIILGFSIIAIIIWLIWKKDR